MKMPTRKEILEILEAKLAEDYPDESVESGENWEVIAEIFYRAGFDAASAA